MIKTLEGFREGEAKDLGEYLGFTYNETIIQEVDCALYMEMLELLPPHFMSMNLFQMGEPSSSIDGLGETYTTFFDLNDRYFCLGDHLSITDRHCFRIASKIMSTQTSIISLGINEGEKEIKQEAKLLQEIINELI